MEVSQEVFIKTLNSLHKIGNITYIKSWIYKVTVNTALNYLRKRASSKDIIRDDNNEFQYIEDKTIRADVKIDMISFNDDFNKALAQLPEKQRETFALKYFGAMTYDEMSETLGTSIGGLKANYFQAVKKLAEILKEYKMVNQ